MKRVVLPLLLTSALLIAGGYKIPETSLNAVALSAANVAHSQGADAAYYNPANMIFMKDENILEVGLMYIGLGKINYQGSYTNSFSSTTSGHNIDTNKENFLVPSLNYVSGDVNGARFGLSIASSAGLSKRWSSAPAVYVAEEFTLHTVEVNPTVALRVGEKLAVAVGIRGVYANGVVKSTSPIASRDMDGDSIDFGYNLALSYKPTSKLDLALTYRSKIDLNIEGDATLFYQDVTNSFGGGVGTAYSSSSEAEVSVPIPALLSIAVAYTLPTETTLEFVYERNFWHSYSELDFNYGSSVNPVTNYVFGRSVAKNWKDTNAFRFGITQELDKFTVMGGVVFDQSPIPDSTLSFELPDSNSVSISLGTRYQINEKLNAGIAALYSIREDRRVSNETLDGEFTDADVLIVSAGLEYKF